MLKLTEKNVQDSRLQFELVRKIPFYRGNTSKWNKEQQGHKVHKTAPHKRDKDPEMNIEFIWG